MKYRTPKGGGLFAVPDPWRQHHTRHGLPKKAYESEALALEIATEMAQLKSSPFSAYQCIHCSLWHVGNERRPRRVFERELLDFELECGSRAAANLKEEILHPSGSIKSRWEAGRRILNKERNRLNAPIVTVGRTNGCSISHRLRPLNFPFIMDDRQQKELV
jgi:hypothetical protein